MNPRNPISPQYHGDGEASWEECQKKNPLRSHVNNRKICILWLLTDQCMESDRFLCLWSIFRTFVTSFSHTQNQEPVRENHSSLHFSLCPFFPPIPCHWLPFFSKWKGNAGIEHKKKEQGQFQTVDHPGSQFLRGESHGLQVGKQSKHSCCCTDYILCVCVCVCVHPCGVSCMCRCICAKQDHRGGWRTCVGVWDGLNEHNVDNRTEGNREQCVLDITVVLHSRVSAKR